MSDRPDDYPDDHEVVSDHRAPGFVKWIIIALGALIAVVIVALVVAIVGGVSGSEGIASAFRILRDFFIIVLALQGILISFALVVLILQVTSLINLLRNEIKPLIDEARSTLSTVRGTSKFVSQNVTGPVIRVASTVAGVRAFVSELAGIRRNAANRRGAPTERK